MTRKRILVVGESSFISTGFATYALEILKRFQKSGKYELMELGSFAEPPPYDERSLDLPWKYKAVMPARDDEHGLKIYQSNPDNIYGAAAFDQTCLEFEPDIVMAYRDTWMDSFIEQSPFRKHFHFAWMPTVDAEPQRPSWLASYMEADSLFTYSDWAVDLLRKYNINVICSTPPGADFESFQAFQDKRAHRERLGMDPNAFIIGTVMRNQKRKLYPDLIEAFAVFLKQAPIELANKTFLYLHTSWPDIGWDIPYFLSEAGICHKTIFTYACKKCGEVFPAFFQDSRSACPRCNQYSATFPTSAIGVSRETLNGIYNLFDVYVQYASNEGFGIPIVEAASCGIPVFATDYSAMSDVLRKVNGFPIKVQRFFTESETNRKMALPDNQDFVNQLINFLQKPEPLRRRCGWEARQGAEKHYNWDVTAQKWMDRLDQVEPSKTWRQPPKLHQPNVNVPNGLTNEEFVRWCLTNVVGRPELANGYLAVQMTKDLNWGAYVGSCTGGPQYFNELSILGERTGIHEFNREMAMNMFLDMNEKWNFWEERRAHLAVRGKE